MSRSKMRHVVLSAVLAGHCSAVLADGPTATAPDGTFNGARFWRSSADDCTAGLLLDSLPGCLRGPAWCEQACLSTGPRGGLACHMRSLQSVIWYDASEAPARSPLHVRVSASDRLATSAGSAGAGPFPRRSSPRRSTRRSSLPTVLRSGRAGPL